MRRPMIIAVGAFCLGVGVAGGMVAETAKIGDLMVMRNQRGECVAYDPQTARQTVFGMPSSDGVCHLASYRAIWWPTDHSPPLCLMPRQAPMALPAASPE